MVRVPVLEARSLSYAYAPGQWAVRNVDLSVPAGSKIALLGANGAGKSSLLLLLAGVEHACHGEVLLNGEKARSGAKSWRAQVSLLLQDPEDQLLAPTVEQDVAFAPMQAGAAESAVRQRVADALESLGIAHLKERPVHELSLGEKKRVALAGLIVERPRVLLLDEPTSGLDAAGVRSLLAVLDSLAAAGTAIVQATHDVDLAYEWAREVCVLFQGGVLASGDPQVVLADSEMLENASLEPPLLLDAALALGSVPPHPRSREEFRRWVGLSFRRTES